MHNSGLFIGTVENHVSESRRTELSRVLSTHRRRKGKETSNLYAENGLFDILYKITGSLNKFSFT